MEWPLVIGVVGVFAVLLLGAFGLPVAVAMSFVGLIGTGIVRGWPTMVYVLGSAPIDTMSNYTLCTLPLFLLMGAVAVHSGMSESLYRFTNGLVGHRRGGLAMATILACLGFGAMNHTSVGTVATMGRIAVPEMLRYGYHRRLAAGAVVAGGTLGILVPPSLQLIFYGIMTETSIGKLFAGALLPAVVAVLLYMGAVACWTALRPSIAPSTPRVGWREFGRSVGEVWSVLLLLFIVLGGLYGGIFDSIQAAGVGAAGATLITLLQRSLTPRKFVECVFDTVRLTAVLYLILIGVGFFQFFVDSIGLPKLLQTTIAALDLPPYQIMIGIVLCLIFCGCVMEAIAIVFIFTPILFPIVVGLGFDPVWFGVVMVMIVELGLILPPLGINIYVLVAMNRELTMVEAFKGAAPFVAADFLRIALMFVFPEIILWLPSKVHL